MRKATAVGISIGAMSIAACGGVDGTPGKTASPAPTALATGAGSGAVIGGSPGGVATASAAKQYDIRGRVEAIPRERVSVTITHDEIPGVMTGMTTMEYGITDPSVVDGLAAGDHVEGRIEARSGGYVIVALKKR